MIKNKPKVFITNDNRYCADWLGFTVVDNIKDANIVYFSGYKDISPRLYSASNNSGAYTLSNTDLDEKESKDLHYALSEKKVIVGVNRGLHLIAAKFGAKIIQHMQHPAKHRIKFYDGTKMTVNSDHHQMVNTRFLKTNDFKVIAYAEGLSNMYLDAFDMNTIGLEKTESGFYIEPEIIYFPFYKSIGFQYDPNVLPFHSDATYISRQLVKRVFEGNLQHGLNLNKSLKEITVPTYNIVSAAESQEEQLENVQ